MEFVIIYAVYAVVVALLSNIVFTRYALNTLNATGIENIITEHPVLVHLTMLVIHVLIAPLMTAVLLSTDKTTRLCVALEQVLAKD